MSRIIRITEGELSGPTALPRHWGYRPYQRREYDDGLVMLLESTETGYLGFPSGLRVQGTIWVWADGQQRSAVPPMRAIISSPADIGGLLVRYRNQLRKLGLYGEHGVYNADGTRLAAGAR